MAMPGQTALTHEAAKPLECPWDTYMGIDLDEDTACSMDVYLKETCLIERRVKESEKTLEPIISDQRMRHERHMPDE